MLSTIEYFKRFFDDNLIVHIAEQTNLYNTQEKFNSSSGKTLNTDSNEIEQLIGILLLMGIYPNPQYRMYWNPSTALPQITNALKGGLTRFETLKQYLHFNDNSKQPELSSPQYDKLYKIRPVIESVLNKCRNVEPGQYNAVDKQMIPTKTKNSMKQYLPKKPHKWGFKVFSRFGSFGIIYEFYTGFTQEKVQML